MVEKKRIEDVSITKYLQTCDIGGEKFKADPFAMVIFGGTGDLSRKKLLPALFYLFRHDELPPDFSILGVGGSPLDDEKYRAMVKESLRGTGEEPFEEDQWGGFQKHVFYFSGNLEKDETYEQLRSKMDQVLLPGPGGRREVIFYLALPPHLLPGVVGFMDRHGFARAPLTAKVIVEKPFGRDVSSARDLNLLLSRTFKENQIYRIDHYLGKETVQNIIFLRFSNSIFEQLWNRHSIDNIQITVAEEIGVENRARFYEDSGVIRDIVQNHILQLVGMIAMEPPVGFEADFIRDEKTKVFRSIHPMEKEHIEQFTVVGQYGAGRAGGEEVPGYRQEKGVAPDSQVPTFFAGVFYIANWRWAGVPFYVRTGKRMAKRITEIAIQFDQPPLRLFGRACDTLEPNILLLTIQPEEKISLRLGVKVPNRANEIYPIDMKFGYRDTFQAISHPAYERLIIDCLKGDLTLFVRQDQVEAMWEAVDPIIAYYETQPKKKFPNYAAGSWGPQEAEEMLEREGRSWITR